MLDTHLKGKVALISGANHGIGAATAKALAAQGVSVLLNYLRLPTTPTTGAELFYASQRAKHASPIVNAIRNNGGLAEAIEANLANPQTIPLLFERAEALFGPVDILVNNADHCTQDTFLPNAEGKAPDGFPTTTFSAEVHDRHFAVNSRAVALMMTEFLRRRVAHGRQWGRIINISTDGAPGFAGEVSYGASKYALESYSRAAAVEMGTFGITVNVVSPGPIQTGWITPEMESEIAASTPLGRVGQPEDIADVIVFLASEQARWISGQILSVSGGRRSPS